MFPTKKRLFSEYFGKSVDEFDRAKKKMKRSYIDLDELVRHRIYSFLNSAQLKPFEKFTSARYILRWLNYEFNYLRMLQYTNLTISTTNFATVLEILQSFLLMCDGYKFTNQFKIKIVGESNNELKTKFENDFPEESFKIMCNHQGETKHIKIYNLSEPSEFEFYNYLPLKVVNKIPHFSHLFYLYASYPVEDNLLINPRYVLELDFSQSQFNKIFSQSWQSLVQLYQQNQILLQSLTDKQIYQSVVSEKIEIYKPPTFTIRNLNIIINPSDTVKHLISYFQWNKTPIQKIILSKKYFFEIFIETGLVNHPQIQIFQLHWSGVDWPKYTAYKQKLQIEWGELTEDYNLFKFYPQKVENLSHVSFVLSNIYQLMKMWPHFESYLIQKIEVELENTIALFQLNNLIRLENGTQDDEDDSEINILPINPKQPLQHWTQTTYEIWYSYFYYLLNISSSTNTNEDEFYHLINKLLTEFFGWNWSEKWVFQFDLRNVTSRFILVRRK